jgi:SRSO17 transposase
MSATISAPGSGQQKRFAAYLDILAQAAGHADRIDPLKSYCTGLLLPGERKSVEPMAARLAPNNVQRMHQSLHHVVADAPWSDEALLRQVRDCVLPVMEKNSPIVAWIIDDTGFPKKGTHSVGVARQYCGQTGKTDNCQVAVSLSVATWNSSLPIAWRLYLPESWTQSKARCQEAGIPKDIQFQTKPEIALEQIRQAMADGMSEGVVLADPAYGNNSVFRQGLTALGRLYMVGIESSTKLWPPGQQPLPALHYSGRGQPPRRLRHDDQHAPVTAKELAMSLPANAWKRISWRKGTRHPLRSRFAALRVRPAHRDYNRTVPHQEEWLLIEWPRGEAEPTKYWLSTWSAQAKLRDLVLLAKQRWIIERDYQELKQELGLGHFEGRGWRGFHHHATLCIAAYGFLVAERNRFSPSAHAGHLELSAPQLPPDFRPRGSTSPRAT